MSLKNTIEEFKEFAVKGNVIDMAVGVIIGGAFGKIVSSLVNDIMMPLLGALTTGFNFTELFISLDGVSYPSLAEAQAVNAPILNYGVFLSATLDFIIISFTIFILLKQLTRLKKTPPQTDTPATTKDCPYCKSTIALEATRCPHCTSILEEQK
jgi:large conductance mechanosensitive channel